MLSSEHGEGSGFFAGPGRPGFLVGFAARNDRTLVGGPWLWRAMAKYKTQIVP